MVVLPTPGAGENEVPKPEEKKKQSMVKEQTSTGDAYIRTGYYNAESQFSNGLVFMNMAGGQGSGDFDMECV